MGGLARWAAEDAGGDHPPQHGAFSKRPDDDARTYQELSRKDRYQLAFGVGSLKWDEERVLDRYELLYGSG